MSIEKQMEREEENIEDRLSSGEISATQYNKEMHELQREYRAMAEESACEAYDNEMGRW